MLFVSAMKNELGAGLVQFNGSRQNLPITDWFELIKFQPVTLEGAGQSGFSRSFGTFHKCVLIVFNEEVYPGYVGHWRRVTWPCSQLGDAGITTDALGGGRGVTD